jgi:predicted DNA-binding transcriptional regulator YafY
MVRGMSEGPPTRDELLARLGIGLRTFYRELELLRRCGVRVRLRERRYVMATTPAQAEDLLPFPDPRLSFAEMKELSGHPGMAARRLAQLLERVLQEKTTRSAGKRSRSKKEG